ncbi:hypothetical protein GLAREA_12570 [Glarea lozoyensis ATCC 20868]|uniref:Uncharacterized protein n=1 Tax=Glarea lozoyensis (strain ATCC 20868 / MF5171) TaxID=1116229 RepID=S3CY99_GLAL2|nr:uncharacterized protein GLAREA_12570 [Glarea lozoyensis ATCC 20868]EPE31267.1 hypothetical protein GLAREA_12570 [Glarea lozoyensis ATCC 20868]
MFMKLSPRAASDLAAAALTVTLRDRAEEDVAVPLAAFKEERSGGDRVVGGGVEEGMGGGAQVITYHVTWDQKAASFETDLEFSIHLLTSAGQALQLIFCVFSAAAIFSL